MFFRQARVGLGGRTFDALKFRSMVPDAEARTGPVQATENDPRITRVGRVMRATAMDELPQLWNIFAGDMSFVGPRPLRPGEVEVRGDGQLVQLDQIPGYRRASQHQARADRTDPGLCVARHLAHQQVPSRSGLSEAGRLLARPQTDHAVVLDHRYAAPGRSATGASLNSPLIMLATHG